MMSRVPVGVLVVSLWVSVVAGCAGSDDHLSGQLDNAELEQISSTLFADRNVFWTGTPPLINVCWEPGTPSATMRGWVRDAIESQWVRHARVNFVGWDFCTSSTQAGVHVREWQTAVNAGEIPSTAPFGNANAYGNTPSGRSGRFVNGVYGAVTVNFCNGLASAPAPARENCVRHTALHEFGHVLGFYHEEEHPKYTSTATGKCADQTPNPTPTTPQQYGAVDTVSSVMSYCAEVAGDLIRLGPNDIAGVQRAYGRRLSGQFVTPRGNCLSANAFNPGNPGAKPFLWDCDEFADDQEWARGSRSFSLHPSSVGAGVLACLYHSSGDAEIRDCDQTLSQSWDWNDVEVRGWGDKCLDLPNGTTANGTPLQLWDCFSDRVNPSYNSNQRWNVTRVSGLTGFEIRFRADTTKCATLNATSPTDGTPLVIRTCDGRTSQRFNFGGGSIRFAVSGVYKCFDAAGVNDAEFRSGLGGPYDGAAINLLTCSAATLNQKWSVSGQIDHALGGCLNHPSEDLGARLQTQTCIANPASSRLATVWDFWL